MRFQKIFFVISLLLFAALLFAQSSAELRVGVVDKNGHVVSDVLIFANYQETQDSKLINKYLNGTTNNGGAFDTTIYFTENATPASHMFISAYHPYSSSNTQRTRIPLEQDKIVITKKITLPIEFETYRIRVSQKDGPPLSQINVHLLYPYFVSKKTEISGIAQFRVPKGITPYGRIEYDGKYQNFNFQKNGSNFLDIQYPFTDPKNLTETKSYSLNLQMFDSLNEFLSTHPIIVSTPYSNATYLTDSSGNLRVQSIPSQNITLYWRLYNYTYSHVYNLQDAIPPKLVSDRLLKIHTPSIIHLGESCYRVEVNITDPREGALKQVVAKALDGNKSIAITLEQNQTINQSQISFNRIFCVVDDTTFDIIASSPYENASLRIKLLKTPESTKSEHAKPSSDEPLKQGIPNYIKEQQEEQKKVELLVTLVELLFFFIVLYLGLKFRHYLIYYLQAISRFTHTYLESMDRKKPKDE